MELDFNISYNMTFFLIVLKEFKTLNEDEFKKMD